MSRQKFAVGLFSAIVIALLPVFVDPFVMHLLTYGAIITILALSHRIAFGMTHLIALGGNGFFACGAYVVTLLLRHTGIHYFLTIPVALLATAALTLIVSTAVLRLRAWVLALGTLSFGYAFWLILRSVATDTLGGDDGLSVPKVMLFDVQLGNLFYYYFIMAFAALCFFCTSVLASSRAGWALTAIREDETAASAAGVDIQHYLRLAFLTHGLFYGLAGSLYAAWNGWISPASCGPIEIGMDPMIFAVVGGQASALGSVVGTGILVLLPYAFLPAREFHPLLYGCILFVALRFLSKGIVGSFQDIWDRYVKVHFRGGLHS